MTDRSLYEQFLEARKHAIELTDRYWRLVPDDPARAIAWASVVQQTEVARQLLETWLMDGDQTRRTRPRQLIAV